VNASRTAILLLIAAGLASVAVSGSTIASRLLYLGVILFVGARIWTASAARSLRLRRHARAVRLNVGDVLVEHFELENRSRVIVPWVQVENRTDLPAAAGSRLLTMLHGGQTQSFLARTWLTRRGGFSLGPTVVTTGDPLGLFRETVTFPAVQTLTVLPMQLEVESFLSPPGLLPGGRAVRGKALDVTPHAAGVREYVHGDPMKRIHWPMSTRHRRLMVKEFERDPQAEVWLILDAQAGVHVAAEAFSEAIPIEAALIGSRPRFALPRATLEYAVTIAASLVRYFLRQRRAVGLLSEGRTYTVIAADRSSRQESKILETLAFVEAKGGMSLGGLVAAQLSQFPSGSTCVLITTTRADDVPIAAATLGRRNIRPAVVLLEAESFRHAGRRDEGRSTVQDSRIPTCRIAYGDDIARALSSVSSRASYSEGIQWQRQPLPYSI
jgi:uncharacterized protein (DUF58 family)